MDTENNKEAFPHDEEFSKIFDGENKSISKFFEALFGYFYRNSPEIIFDSAKFYGKQVMVSNFEKWENKYLSTIKPKNLKRPRSDTSLSESESESCLSDCWKEVPKPGGQTSTINTTTVSKRISNHSSATYLTGSKKEEEEDGEARNKLSFFDTTNGASLDKYCWTQSIDELEVKIPVEKSIRKGTQVEVEIEKRHLRVKVQQENKEFATVVDEDLLHHIRVDASMWLLSPEQHISLLLEKGEEMWWDRLLVTDPPIDMKKINAERDFQTLPDPDKQMIQQVVEDKKSEALGKPTIVEKKMETVLRKAWDMEGSPFRGKPFDPSIVKAITSSAANL